MSDDAPDEQFEELLDYLTQTHRFDFRIYKRSSLVRRAKRRLDEIEGVHGFGDYLDYLQVHPEEFTHLFNTILINVTGFFRDTEAWDFVRDDVIPRILAGKDADTQVRVWSAGCASGEETYSAAMLLAEAIGLDAFKQRVKLYATDIDEDALSRARTAAYEPREVAGVPSEYLGKYFEPVNGRHVFRPELRRSIIFGRHDLVVDAPISRIDLLLCRNTLMYLTAETQPRVLARMHFALNETGFLFLGRAEMLLTHANLFHPVDLKHRVFAKVAQTTLPDHLLVLAQAADGEMGSQLARQVRLREAGVEASPVALLIVDTQGRLTIANEQARTLFNINIRDLERPLYELEVSYRPVDLRSCIDEAMSTQKVVKLSNVTRELPGGMTQHFDVHATPLMDHGRSLVGVAVAFIDVSVLTELQVELGRSKQQLETAYQELQSTNEELETTNEELQSTVEELETTNEELQSTNEELETTNEELQSTNAELHAINTEFRQRRAQLDELNVFMGVVLASMGGGIAVINGERIVRVWTPRAEALWGLRADEVMGRDFIDLDFGLPVESLREPLRHCLDEGTVSELVVDAVNRLGRSIRCEVTLRPLRNAESAPHGAVVTMDEVG
jgi:two-component system CheB/CheR fusion protein